MKLNKCPHCPLFNQEVFLSFPENQPWGRIVVNCPNCGIVFTSNPFGYGNKPVEVVTLQWNAHVKTIPIGFNSLGGKK